ncbi:MAG: hypothetical protein ABI549_11745 [Flavobacterium sp.]|uniref:hypothetical protein n=1 Tax=Flavobacterium sp. TaxID=239 RepID=UPI003265AAB7
MKNRTLLKENKVLCQEIKNDLIQFKPVLAELKRSYESLELGAFNDSIFKTLMLTGSQNTISFYLNNLNEQLDRLGISSKIMKENMISNHTNVIEKFKNSIQNAKLFKPTIYHSRPLLSIKFISFNEVFVISKEDEEVIFETYCRIYINENELPVLEMANELLASYNNFLSFIEDQGISNNNSNCLNLLFSFNNGEPYVDADKLQGLITYKKRALDFQNRFTM